jgi:hypothetical protein
MDDQEARSVLESVKREYDLIKSPKYRHADLDHLIKLNSTLANIKPYLSQNKTCRDLVNGITQTLSRIKPTSTWRNVSERGLNKAVPVVRTSTLSGNQIQSGGNNGCGNKELSAINGEWGATNYMVMDVLAYFFLLKEGGDQLPKDPTPIFVDLESITQREAQLNPSIPINCAPGPASKAPYYIRFTDKDFRKFTGVSWSSRRILSVLRQTSQVEFKLTYPVRLRESGQPMEKEYKMTLFSRFYEFGFIDKKLRNDNVVQEREYKVHFNTILGELFIHNLMSTNYDWVEIRFYKLPSLAQLFYRKFLLHNNFPMQQINLFTIAERLNLSDRNVTNLAGTIEQNALSPLEQHGLITSFKKEPGLQGFKYVVCRPSK